MKLTGVGLPLAETLFKGGYASLVDISEAEVEDIASITDLTASKIEEMIKEAKVILEEELNQEKQDGGEPEDNQEPEEDDQI